jgi:hypothetical protein
MSADTWHGDAPVTDGVCDCRHWEADECHRRRYGIVMGDVSHGAEECLCVCHQWAHEEDEPQSAVAAAFGGIVRTPQG